MQSLMIKQDAFKVLTQIMNLPHVRGFKIINKPEDIHVALIFFYRHGRMEHIENYFVPKDDDLDIFSASLTSTFIDAYEDLSGN